MSSASQDRKTAALCLHISSWLSVLAHRAKPDSEEKRSFFELVRCEVTRCGVMHCGLQ